MFQNYLAKINHKIPTRLLGPGLIAIAATLWALDGILRRSLYELPPLTIVFFEHLVGSILLIPIFFRSRNQLKPGMFTKKNIGILAAVSILSGLLGTLFFTTALLRSNFIPFSVVFLLQKLQPLFATSTAVVFLKERISKKYVLWATLALVAAYFVTFPNGMVVFSLDNQTAIAALYAVLAAAAWGIGTTLSKRALHDFSATMATSMRFFLTTIFAFIGLALFTSIPDMATISIPQYFRLILIALSTGMVALFIYYKGLKKTEAKISTIIELVFPFLAVIIDGVVYKTFLTPTQLLASIILLISIYKTAKINAKNNSL